MTEISTTDNVYAKSAAVEQMSCAWRLVSDLMGGTSAMRKAGRRHLPKWTYEEECDYEIRRCTATLFPAYSRTVSVLTGKPFSKPVAIGDDVPERIAAWLEEDADLEGRNLTAFATDLCADALAYGLCGILVDVPPSNGAKTIEEETALGIRPYLVHVKHDAILGWRSKRQGGSMVLTQLRLLETVEEESGDFSVKQVEQVRVLTPGRWEIHRKVTDANGVDAWLLHAEGDTKAAGVPLDVIPFVPIYGRRVDFMVGEPPMLDLAYLNVEHWQSKSDQQTILHAARVPILFIRGVGTGTKVVVGAGALIRAEDPAADMKYVEHTGSAIEAGRTSLQDLEDQMRQVGAELLVIKPGNTSVAQTFSDAEPGMCDLQRIMQTLEDGLDLALEYMARFAGEESGGHVDIFSDFGVATQSEAYAQLLVGMQSDGLLTRATTLAEMKRRGALSPNVDVDKEAAAAKAERDADQAASAKRDQAMLYGHDQGHGQDPNQNLNPNAAGADAGAA